MGNENITIADVAAALGVSKTTVSRAISGKGRIGDATRQRVLAYIEEHNYRPNVIAKGLAQSVTFNICVVMPDDYVLVDLPFFHEVIVGIQETASENGYDILLCVSRENETGHLRRILDNRKVDGVILLRTFLKDLHIELLQEKKIPFVTAGSTLYRNTTQVDNDHSSACAELTLLLLSRGFRRIALFGGAESFVVTQSRLLGYHEAFAQALIDEVPELIFMNLDREAADAAVETAISRQAECILCMDDMLCSQVLGKLRMLQVSVPEEMCVASYYNSSVLSHNVPDITSLSFNERELGKEACRLLLEQLAGADAPKKLLLSYQIVEGSSTCR